MNTDVIEYTIIEKRTIMKSEILYVRCDGKGRLIARTSNMQISIPGYLVTWRKQNPDFVQVYQGILVRSAAIVGVLGTLDYRRPLRVALYPGHIILPMSRRYAPGIRKLLVESARKAA